MQQEMNTDKTEPTIDEQVTQCIKDNEVLSNLDLVAYLRSQEAGVELPPTVDMHLKICRVCAENWKFVQETDPILRQFRKKRIQLVIRTVIAEENPSLPDMPKEGLTADKNEKAVQQITAALSPSVIKQEASNLAQSLPTSELCYISLKIVELQKKIRAIPDEAEGAKAIKDVASIFEASYKNKWDREFVTPFLNCTNTLVQSREKSINLSTLPGIPLYVAIAMFAAMDINLLKEENNTIHLDLDLFRQTQLVPA